MRCAITGCERPRNSWLKPVGMNGRPLLVVDQPPLRARARDGGLENVGVADFLHPPDRLLGLEPVDHRLDGGVGRPVLLGKRLLDFAHRQGAARQQRVHDLHLELRQSR